MPPLPKAARALPQVEQDAVSRRVDLQMARMDAETLAKSYGLTKATRFVNVLDAGYADKMDRFFRSNPGFRSRVAHHIDFPDYADDDLLAIGEKMLASLNYRLSASARETLAEYMPLRRGQPLFANARSIRNALDRARLRQANRLFAERDRELTLEAITTIEASDLRQSRVFQRDGCGA